MAKKHPPLTIIWNANNGEGPSRPVTIHGYDDTVTFQEHRTSNPLLKLEYKDGTITLTPLTLMVTLSAKDARDYADHIAAQAKP